MAGTIYRIADVLSVVHSTASTYRFAIVPYAVLMGRHGEDFFLRGSRLETRRRLAISLKLAIRALEGNIRKLERAGGSSLLIVTRKKRLARLQEELAKLADQVH